MINVKRVDLTKVSGEIRFLVMKTLLTAKPIVVFRTHEKGKKIIVELCEILDFPYREELEEEKGISLIEIKREMEVSDAITDKVSVIANFSPSGIANRLTNPSILLSFIPEIRGIKDVSPSYYFFTVNWPNKITVPFVLHKIKGYGPKYIIRYLGYTKSLTRTFLLKIDFTVSKNSKGSKIEMTESYKGSFMFLADDKIKKHISLFKEKLHSILF
ncbi:hypothetical protein ATY89_09740 [Sulfolobus acidocaldarius]|uniref:Conserved protein n=5 Tax=Sulfolobus acidocaldarius TaxID=2285 RepID=Q4J895_SULAC|nr:hypothetical protein [Sulfolobus acidocaldarius]AAY80986.1 conserved protein [Sulfolobus acidocaldarius DSM 639]AGE71587.1 hypothetical protein SacN8_08135 [Sulfolobus acidocaldarius N8]AGE73860.1 hypothetical protein SacRon12I_08145 [Sulfolobus acidocaldarius Ron12/I]ALU30646.1 hypothetical protein ATY89_09740 [Sulfolobus acidocaldarius]ALU32738.1 hypothetical protein ATZ20_01295 [Sulfolobus acidocaldarius]